MEEYIDCFKRFRIVFFAPEAYFGNDCSNSFSVAWSKMYHNIISLRKKMKVDYAGNCMLISCN